MSIDNNMIASVGLVKTLSDDIREGADGTTYATAGNAVRATQQTAGNAIERLDAIMDEQTFTNTTAAFNDITVDYSLPIGGAICITSTVRLPTIDLKANGSVVKSISISPGETKTYTSEYNVDQIRFAFSDAGSVTVKRLDTVIEEMKSNIDSAIGELEETKEDVSNKVAVISVSSTDVQYPSAKCVYDAARSIQDDVNYILNKVSFDIAQNRDITEDFSVISGKTYQIFSDVNLVLLQTKDAENQVVQTINSISANTWKTFTATGNAVKIRIYASGTDTGTATVYDSQSALMQVKNESDAAIDSIDTRVTALEAKTLNNPFYGKNMVVVGDSISAGVYTTIKWHDIIKDRYGLAGVTNLSATGASYTKNGSMNNPRFTKVVENITGTPDIISVFGGTNDFSAYKAPIGSIDDPASNADGATFYAAVKYTMEYLLTEFPDAKIIYITPLQRNYTDGFNAKNTAGAYLIDYVNVIRELTSVYGVILCDLYANSQFHVFNTEFKSTYTPVFGEFTNGEGLHPNTAGTEYYTKYGIIPTFDRILLDWNGYITSIVEEMI